jgi:hypothetical protein
MAGEEEDIIEVFKILNCLDDMIFLTNFNI